MTKLKLGPLIDETPIKLTAELPAAVYRDLTAYAELLGQETDNRVEPARIVAPMLSRFMATDRGFAKLRRTAAGLARVRSKIPKAIQTDDD